MRVLLISANQERSPDPVAPLGVCYVATAAAEAGHDVRVLDLCFSEDVERDVVAAVAAMPPEVIGVSLRNVDNCAYPDTVSYLSHYRRVVEACRAASDATIVLGGSAFTTMPEFYLRALRVAYGVVGEGEATFAEMLARRAAGADPSTLPGVASWDAPSGRVRSNLPVWLPTLDALRASRAWIDNQRYFELGGMANLQTKRGCHFKCTFCAYPVIEGRGMRTRDPSNVAAEAKMLLDQHGLDQFFIVDSIFNAPRGYAERVCEALRPLGRHIRWSCFVSPGNFTTQLAELMIHAGCQSVDFGTDAASDPTLRGFRKSFNVDDIVTASTVCRERGLPFCHSLVFGGEGETWDTMRETIATIDACRPTAVIAMCGVRVYPDTPFAHTLLARGEIAGVERLYEPYFYFSPAVRDGLVQAVVETARARRNWLLPGNRVNDEDRVVAQLRGRGVKGDLWRFLPRASLARPLSARASGSGH